MLNEDEGVLANKFPICDYNEQYYADWLLSNNPSLNVQKGVGLATYGIGILSLLGAIVRSSFRWCIITYTSE